MASSIYSEYESILPKSILEEAQKECKEHRLNSTQVKKVLEKLTKVYENSRITPGEAIGIITAESFGEPGTQMTLNVFHFAGVSEMQVTEGLPRLIEIFDARANPQTPRMEVHLKPAYTKDEKIIKKTASKIKEMALNEISDEFSINMFKGCVDVTLNLKKMKDFGIHHKEVVEVLTKELKGIEVKESKKGLILNLKEGNTDLTQVYKLKEKAKSTIIRGIKGITHVLPMKKQDKFVVICAGSNLKDVLNMEEVDAKYTTTNNIKEIEQVLGIEAARQSIINESISVIESQGLDINIRHIMFISEIMTSSGTVKGITRGGITGEKESVLARASFETPIKHIIDASLIGEEDKLKSVIENVILNQPIPVGTGLPGLVVKVKKDAK